MFAGLGPAALLAFAPGILNGLFGLLGGNPQKKLQKKINRLLSPENQKALTNQFYQQALGSPAFSQAQGQIATGANQAGSDIASSLAQRGIGTSGTGAILPGLISSLVGSQQAGLRTSAFQGAQNQAQNTIQQQIANLQGTSGPSQTQQLFASGLDALGPILAQYFNQQKTPPSLPSDTDLQNIADWTNLSRNPTGYPRTRPQIQQPKYFQQPVPQPQYAGMGR
jgi:hypothetical protein